jgi:phosphoribosyl 1,2-cyclic phosphate phosphodiesterase
VQGGPIPCYATADVWATIRRVFHYIFDDEPLDGRWIPKVACHEIDTRPFSPGGVHVVPVPLLHGTLPILGFRFGTFAYLTDCSAIPDASWALVDGVETLVIDGLRDRPHATHFSVSEALEAVARIAPARAYFTHMNHELGHVETNARLPPGVELAYDGLVLDVEVDAS